MDIQRSRSAEAVRSLTKELPLNDFGLPRAIYRVDLLPFDTYIPPTENAELLPSPPIAEDLPSPLIENDLPSPPGSNGNLELPASEEFHPNESSKIRPPSDAELVDSSPTSEEFPVPSADAFSLMAGQGDGLPDPINYKPVVRRALPEIEESPSLLPEPKEYRIGGFLAKDLHNALVPLQYDEGFPAFESGLSFWAKMDFEPADAYMAFDRYLKMHFGRTADLEDEDDFGEAAGGIRSISALVNQMFPEADDVRVLQLVQMFTDYSHTYYWGLRARSYDLFRVTQYKQQQEIRAIETQDDHYIEARKFRAKLSRYMHDDEDFWDLMTPKVAIDMHRHLTALERISAGVPATGPQTKEETGGGKTFELAFRTIAQDQHSQSTDGTLMDEEGDVLEQALDDPAATKILQELIIKSGG